MIRFSSGQMAEADVLRAQLLHCADVERAFKNYQKSSPATSQRPALSVAEWNAGWISVATEGLRAAGNLFAKCTRRLTPAEAVDMVAGSSDLSEQLSANLIPEVHEDEADEVDEEVDAALTPEQRSSRTWKGRSREMGDAELILHHQESVQQLDEKPCAKRARADEYIPTVVSAGVADVFLACLSHFDAGTQIFRPFFVVGRSAVCVIQMMIYQSTNPRTHPRTHHKSQIKFGRIFLTHQQTQIKV